MNESTMIGYLAGFFDGEGSIYRNPRTGRWYVNASNTVCKSLVRFVDIFGGSIHKTERKNPRWKPVYQWYASGEVGIKFCMAVLPYIVIKRERVEKALAEDFGLKSWPRQGYLADPEPYIARRAALQARREKRLDRQQQALELHRVGLSYRQIGRQLGYKSSAGVYGAVQSASRRARVEQGQDSEQEG